MPELVTFPERVKTFSPSCLKNPLEFREWWKILWRVWRPALPGAQFLVAAFVFDRTVAWGKEWETITAMQFREGVAGSDGVLYASGLWLSAPTISAAIRACLDVKCLRSRSTGRRTAYALNFTWIPQEHTQPITMLLPPKRKSEAQSGQTTDANFAVKGKEILPLDAAKGKKFLPHNYTKRDNCPKNNGAVRPVGVESLKQRLLTTLAATAERQEEKVRALKPMAVLAHWKKLCRTKFQGDSADHLSVGQVDGAILSRYLKKLPFSANHQRVLDYLEFCVSKWSSLRETEFGWMRGSGAPNVPSIRFLVRWHEKFEGAFSNAKSIASAVESGGLAAAMAEEAAAQGRSVGRPVGSRGKSIADDTKVPATLRKEKLLRRWG